VPNLPKRHHLAFSSSTNTYLFHRQQQKPKKIRGKKKIPTLGTLAQRLHSSFLNIDVAARTAHLMTAGSVEYAFEGAFCGKANGV
jgi:hypothetical protein